MSERVYEKTFSVKITRDAETNRIVGEAWRNANGELERDGDLPALTNFDPATGEPVLKVWYLKGQQHREGGPAFEKIAAQSGIVVTEAWSLHDKLHREGDQPARIFRSPETGRVVEEVYATRGLVDRVAGPAVVRHDPMTGRIVRREYWRNGEPATKLSSRRSPSPS